MPKDRGKASKEGQKRVSAKISHLREEGVPEKKAVATALNMERAGRLGPKGGYKRGKKR